MPRLHKQAGSTPAGRELLDDASGVVDDTMKVLLKRSPEMAGKIVELIELLDEFAR